MRGYCLYQRQPNCQRTRQSDPKQAFFTPYPVVLATTRRVPAFFSGYSTWHEERQFVDLKAATPRVRHTHPLICFSSIRKRNARPIAFASWNEVRAVAVIEDPGGAAKVYHFCYTENAPSERASLSKASTKTSSKPEGIIHYFSNCSSVSASSAGSSSVGMQDPKGLSRLC